MAEEVEPNFPPPYNCFTDLLKLVKLSRWFFKFFCGEARANNPRGIEYDKEFSKSSAVGRCYLCTWPDMRIYLRHYNK